MKIKYSALVSDARGKLNGSVASRNQYGAYFRNKVTPTNPNTTSQSLVRQIFTQISQSWRGLSDAQRKQWRAATENFKRTNIFGDIGRLSGFNLYQKLNNNLNQIGESSVSVPPLPTEVQGFTSLSLANNKTAGTMAVSFAPAINADVKVLVFATAPQSAGKNFVKSEYRLIKVLDSTDLTGVDLVTEYAAKFGAQGAIGTKTFIKFVPIELNTGVPGAELSASDIAV